MEKKRDCTHFGELLKIQRMIVEKHLNKHKWFQHIADEEQARIDFIEKFGWTMREFLCGYTCPDRFRCAIAEEYLPPPADPK